MANAPDVAAKVRARRDDNVTLPLRDHDFTSMHGRGITARLGQIPEPPYGDDFYRRVAASYSALARQVTRPAAELAEANDLPVTTVHTWVKEARRCGSSRPDGKERQADDGEHHEGRDRVAGAVPHS